MECMGDAANELEALSDDGKSVDGSRLIELAARTRQVIWGEFRGRLPVEVADSLVIKAIDSTLWEVFGSDEHLRKIEVAFHDVRPAEEDAG